MGPSSLWALRNATMTHPLQQWKLAEVPHPPLPPDTSDQIFFQQKTHRRALLSDAKLFCCNSSVAHSPAPIPIVPTVCKATVKTQADRLGFDFWVMLINFGRKSGFGSEPRTFCEFCPLPSWPSQLFFSPASVIFWSFWPFPRIRALCTPFWHAYTQSTPYYAGLSTWTYMSSMLGC